MANYILSNKAIEDMSKIWDYSFEVWSESQADKYYYTLPDTCQQLADEKLIGKPYNEIRNDIFGFKVGRHIVFYRRIGKVSIEITRILHSRTGLKNRIQE